MRSSAMRDLMAITARPEVISLAGGLPGHLDLPARELRRADDPDRARVLGRGAPVRADRGLRGDQGLHRRGDGGRGHVARPRRPDRHHRRPAGDRPDREDADRPRRPGDLRGADLPGRGPDLLQLRGRRDPGHHRRRRDADRRARAGARPTSPRRAGGRSSSTRSRASRTPPASRSRPSGGGGWSSSPASTRCWSARTTPTACSASRASRSEPLYALDGGDYVLYLGTFSKILSPGIRIGWVAAPPPVLEKIGLGKQAADLCTSTLTQYFVREYFAEGRWREYVDDLIEIYRGRRDAMLEALERPLPRAGRVDPARGRPLRLGDPARLHRHHRPAGQGAARERRLRARPRRLRRRPRRPTRCGSTSRARPRTRSARASGGSAASSPSRSRSTRRSPASMPASRRSRSRTPGSTARDVVPMPSRGGGREGRGAQGRPLAGARRLAALGRPGRGRARGARPRGRSPLDVGPDLVARPARGAPRRRLHRPARARRRGRHRPGAARDPRHPLHRPRRRGLRALHGQGRRQARAARGRASRPRTGSPSTPPPSASSGAADTLEEIEERLGFPLVVKPASQGSSLGVEFASERDEVPERAGRRLQLRRPRAARALRRGPRARRRRARHRAAADRRGDPARGGLLRLRGPLRDRAHRLRLPGRAAGERGRARSHDAARAHLRDARLQRLRPRRPDARRRRPAGARGQRDPRAHRHQPLPDGRRGRGARASSSWSSGSSRWRSSAQRRGDASRPRAGLGGPTPPRPRRSPRARRCRGTP